MSTEKRIMDAELRAFGGGQDSQGDEFAIEGYAARFNSESKDLGGFREIIAPSAFTRALAEKQDVFCLMNHSSDKILGRSSSGTLTLSQDDKGLKIRCQLDPNQQLHRDVHSAVKRGDLREMSFAFTPNGENGDHWEDRKDDKGNWYISRTLKDVNLFDASIVAMPAYNTTSVSARAELLSPEVRSKISAMVEKRAKKSVEKRDESVQDMLNCISKCLQAKFPADPLPNGQPCCSYGKYWICDTYEDYVIACTGEPIPAEYVKIPFVENPDGDGYVFGTPTPVEKEWVPSDRAKSVDAEMRAFKASHMKAIADQHTADAAAASATADAQRHEADEAAATAAAHTAAAASAQEEADRMEKCSATSGDCSLKSCRCQNVMVAARDMDDDYENWESEDGDDDAKKDGQRAERKSVEVRAAGDVQVRTKTVGGKQLSKGAFAHVGDSEDTRTWRYAAHDADYTARCMTRWGQHGKDVSAEQEPRVWGKIAARAKKFGIEAPADAATAARTVSERIAAEAKAAKAAQPLTREEITDFENRFRLALLS
jgi:HK97 family phage prohead protease